MTKTREQQLLEAVRKTLKAIESYPDRQHPMTASELILKIALKRYGDDE